MLCNIAYIKRICFVLERAFFYLFYHSVTAPPLLGEVKARLFTEVTLHCEVDWMHESPYGVVEWFKNGHAVPKIVGNGKDFIY